MFAGFFADLLEVRDRGNLVWASCCSGAAAVFGRSGGNDGQKNDLRRLSPGIRVRRAYLHLPYAKPGVNSSSACGNSQRQDESGKTPLSTTGNGSIVPIAASQYYCANYVFGGGTSRNRRFETPIVAGPDMPATGPTPRARELYPYTNTPFFQNPARRRWKSGRQAGVVCRDLMDQLHSPSCPLRSQSRPLVVGRVCHLVDR